MVGRPGPRARHDRAGVRRAARRRARGDAAKAAELQAFVKQTIAPYKYPRAIEFVAALPKTATGKIQRYRLRQLAAESRGKACEGYPDMPRTR